MCAVLGGGGGNRRQACGGGTRAGGDAGKDILGRRVGAGNIARCRVDARLIDHDRLDGGDETRVDVGGVPRGGEGLETVPDGRVQDDPRGGDHTSQPVQGGVGKPHIPTGLDIARITVRVHLRHQTVTGGQRVDRGGGGEHLRDRRRTTRNIGILLPHRLPRLHIRDDAEELPQRRILRQRLQLWGLRRINRTIPVSGHRQRRRRRRLHPRSYRGRAGSGQNGDRDDRRNNGENRHDGTNEKTFSSHPTHCSG